MVHTVRSFSPMAPILVQCCKRLFSQCRAKEPHWQLGDLQGDRYKPHGTYPDGTLNATTGTGGLGSLLLGESLMGVS